MVNEKDVFVGVISALIALSFIGLGGYMFFDYYQQTNNVEAVDATVTSSEVVQTYDADRDLVYRPSITYEYTYDGDTYTSESIFIDDNQISSRSRANELVDEYAAGSETTAYVPSDDPDSTYLVKPGIPWRYFIFPLIGLFVLLLAIGKIRTALWGERGGQQSESI